YLRVNLPARRGEGGSPAVDLNGGLIGMMVASLPEIGSSYLLPVDALLRVRDRLLFSGEMRYGWIGAEFEERISRTDGRYVEIKAVVRGTPAQQAGIRRGDRLIRFGD